MDRQVVIFIGILLLVGSALFAVFGLKLLDPIVFGGLVLLVVVMAVLWPKFMPFPEYMRGVLFRFGKFNKVVGPGLVMTFPYIDTIVEVDLRTQAIDIEPQEVITKDNIKLKIDALVYLRVIDPKKSVIEIKDWKTSAKLFIHAVIRDAVSKLMLEEVISRAEEIQQLLATAFKKVSEEWGIQTLKVEIQGIELPDTLTDAMKKRKEALEEKYRIETQAAAKKIELESLESAASKLSESTLTYMYIESLKQLADGKSNKIIFPLEFTNLLGVIAKKYNVDGEKEGKEIIKALTAAYVGAKASDALKTEALEEEKAGAPANKEGGGKEGKEAVDEEAKEEKEQPPSGVKKKKEKVEKQ